MKHPMACLTVWAFAALGAGCAAPRQQAEPALPGSFSDPRPHLLFDLEPTTFNPERYASREDLLRAPTFAGIDESIRYREWYYDLQGLRLPNRDYFRRTFSSVRMGSGHR